MVNWLDSLVKVSTLLIALGPKLPKAWALLEQLYGLFAEQIEAAGELEVVDLPAEVLAMQDAIVKAMIDQAKAANEPLAMVDFGRMRKLVRFLAASEWGQQLLETLLTKAALPGG